MEPIGQGGFGAVWVADQERPVRRRVALKIIKIGMDTKEVIARFEQERQALAMMDHPHIAKVFDAGATEWGRPFFVMELVRGMKITDYCDQENLPTSERLALFIQVCNAVQHAHQKGIIHRDLKPSNILVTLHDGLPVPKVIDFGVAKATQSQRLTDLTIYTQFQQMIGTPLYMSPEQAEMSGLDVDTRSDIYSLGVLLYELLTGRTPFDPDAMMKAGLDEIRRVIREEEPPKPSTALQTMAADVRTGVAKHRRADAAKIAGLLRGDLDWIVMKALEKDRARRYETSNGLVQDIRRHLANEPVLAAAPSVAYRFHKFARRNKAGLGVAGLIITVLVAATGVSVRQAKLAQKAAADALEAKQDANAKAGAERIAREEAEAITQFLTGVFESPDPGRDGRLITVAETLDKAAKKLEVDLTDQPAPRARLQATLANTYFALGLYHQAIALQEKVLPFYRKAHGPEHPNTLSAMHSLATFYFAGGRQDEAFKLREEVLRLRRGVLGLDHPDTLKAAENMADSHYYARHWDEALRLREEVLTLRRKVLGPEDRDTLWAMHNLADSYFYACRWDEALKMREEVLRLRRKVLGPEHPDTLGAIHCLADSLAEAGRQDEALKLREEALTLHRKVFGPEHPETLWAMHYLADSYAATGRQDEALKLREEVLRLRRKVLGPEHPDTLSAIRNLALSYFSVGRRDEALKLHEEVLTLCRRAHGPQHSRTLTAMAYLAIAYIEAGRRDEALKLREEVLTLRRKVGGPEDTNTLWSIHELAESYADAGRREEALKLREEVLPIRRKVLGPEHPDTLRSVHNLANSYLQAGRVAEAIALLADASTRKTIDTSLAMKVAALQVWFASEADHADTCRRMLQWAANANTPEDAERIAKLICLRPIADASMQQAALVLARRAVELGRDNERHLPWFQLGLGMAEYRSGHYSAADEALATAAKTAPATGSRRPFVEGTASFYRAMSLFKRGRQAEARELFKANESEMKPLPADEKNPLADGKIDHDELILWLAYKEAKALIQPQAPEAPVAAGGK
jgi:tetratricopeptide (TPR) repeat protein